MSLLKNMSIRHKNTKKKSSSLTEYCFSFWHKTTLFDCLIWPPTLSRYKNVIERLKYECLPDIINFRCLLLKADFRISYFELETLLNKLVKLFSCFFSEKWFWTKMHGALFSAKKSTYFLTGPNTCEGLHFW